jgi:biopolymer transport protein ExbD
MSERKRPTTDRVEPDLPITLMLDMAFQLLAFFLITFRPSPTEVQLALALPREDGSRGQEILRPLEADKPSVYTVRVTAAENGTIERVTISEEGAVAAKDLGTKVEAVRDELKAVAAGLSRENRTGKLTLELDEKLVQEYVVQLMDTGARAGFADLSPVPLDPRKR